MFAPDIELLLTYLDGSLPAEAAGGVENRLKTEPRFAELFIKICRDETVLKEWSATVEAETASPAMPVGPAPSRKRWRPYPIAIAASLLLAIGLSVWLAVRQPGNPAKQENAKIEPADGQPNVSQSPVIGKLHDVQGDAYLVSGETTSPVRAGQEIRAGEQVKTGDGGVAVVQLPDSSRFELGSDTQMTFGRVREEMIDSRIHLFLSSGSIRAEVVSPEMGKKVVLTTPHATISAENTRFSSVAAAETTSVEMESGTVEMTMPNGEQVSIPEGRVIITGKKKNVRFDRQLPPRVSLPRLTVPAGAGPVMGVVASTVNKTVAINSWEGAVLLYDFGSEEWLPPVVDHQKRNNTLDFSKDGKRLATGGEDRFARVTRVADRTSAIPIRKHRTGIHAVALSNDGKILATASGVYKGAAEVFLWNVETGVELGSLPGHPDNLSAIAFHPKKNIVVTACRDSLIRVWDVTTLKLLGSYPTDHVKLKAIAFSPDGGRLASAGLDGLIKLWNTEDWTVATTLEGHLAEVCSLAFSPDGKRLASSGKLTTIWLWNVESATPICNYIGHKFKITGVSFSHDGKTLISSGWDRTVKFWDVE